MVNITSKWFDRKVREAKASNEKQDSTLKDETPKLYAAAQILKFNPYYNAWGTGEVYKLEVTKLFASRLFTALKEKAENVNVEYGSTSKVEQSDEDSLTFHLPVTNGGPAGCAKLPAGLFYQYSACTRDTYEPQDTKAYRVFQQSTITLVNEWLHGEGNEEEWWQQQDIKSTAELGVFASTWKIPLLENLALVQLCQAITYEKSSPTDGFMRWIDHISHDINLVRALLVHQCFHHLVCCGMDLERYLFNNYYHEDRKDPFEYPPGKPHKDAIALWHRSFNKLICSKMTCQKDRDLAGSRTKLARVLSDSTLPTVSGVHRMPVKESAALLPNANTEVIDLTGSSSPPPRAVKHSKRKRASSPPHPEGVQVPPVSKKIKKGTVTSGDSTPQGAANGIKNGSPAGSALNRKKTREKRRKRDGRRE